MFVTSICPDCQAAIRSRVFNLRDKKNTALRENVLTGEVRTRRFATMTAEEMASPEMRETRERFTKQAIHDAQVTEAEGTASDMFKCGKCGKKNTTYTQVSRHLQSQIPPNPSICK
jgi:transcription elongation factor S-II